MEPRMVETRLDELSWLFCIVARVFLVIADFFFRCRTGFCSMYSTVLRTAGSVRVSRSRSSIDPDLDEP